MKKKIRISSRDAGLIGLGVMIFFSIYLTVRYNRRLERIKDNPGWSTCYVYNSVDRGGKYPGVTLFYNYSINGVEYKDSELFTKLRKGNTQYFIGKTFPLVYSKNDFKNNKILVIRKDFERFDVDFPDSLKWVDEFSN
jgi:hypothetical protein